MVTSAHGAFHPRGWHINVGDDAGSDLTAVASMHEASHERLQHTTLWGMATQLCFAWADTMGQEKARATASSMLANCRHAHEQFATFTSMTIGHLDIDTLALHYPSYRRHAVSAQVLIAGIDSVYLRLHAIRAAARASMQSADAADVCSSVDLAQLTPAHFDRTMRPDYRLTALARALTLHGWGAPPAPLDRDVDLDEFARDDDPAFDEVSSWYYRRAASLLRELSLATLGYDGHIEAVAAMHRRASDLAGSTLGYRWSEQLEFEDDLDVVIGAHESESLELRGPLPAVVVDSSVPVQALLSGDGDKAHVFIALRPGERINVQYGLDHSWSRELVAVIRTVVLAEGTSTVLLREVVSDDDIAAIGQLAVPVIVSASWRCIADQATLERWRALARLDNSTVLCDLSISAQLISWLTNPDRRLLWSVIGVQTPWVGAVRLLGFQMVSSSGARSRLHLAVVSRTFVRAFEMWVEEHPRFAGRVERDDSLAGGDGGLIERTAHHLLREERVFDFQAGERTWLRPTS